MNSFTFTVLNADIPVMYIEVSVNIHVKFLIRGSDTKVILSDISKCIVVCTLTLVMCVISVSVRREL
jgi:hypothetical protein